MSFYLLIYALYKALFLCGGAIIFHVMMVTKFHFS